uniref:Uncharacterized protein n=1 Tax=Ditylenchus dipsaci TaxID=166011 RepID=A0A915DUB1_9BILA
MGLLLKMLYWMLGMLYRILKIEDLFRNKLHLTPSVIPKAYYTIVKLKFIGKSIRYAKSPNQECYWLVINKSTAFIGTAVKKYESGAYGWKQHMKIRKYGKLRSIHQHNLWTKGLLGVETKKASVDSKRPLKWLARPIITIVPMKISGQTQEILSIAPFLLALMNGFVGRNSPSYVYYSSPSPTSYSNRVISRSSQLYSIPKMTQSAFDTSSIYTKEAVKRWYAFLTLAIFSGDDYFEQQEYSVDSASLRSSYSGWGTHVIRVSDSTSIAVREKEGPIIRQLAAPVSHQPKQLFRLVSYPVKIDCMAA